MLHITITPRDLEKYKIAFSPSGHVIDELAYSAGENVSDNVYEWGGEPIKPFFHLLEKVKI
jgi:hypothetical protein